MKRLLIIGSREFIVNTMDLATSYGPTMSVLGIVDHSGTDVTEDVRQARPDVIVVDGVADFARASTSLSKIRSVAADAVLVVVVGEVDHRDVARALDAGIVVYPQPAGTRAREMWPVPETAPNAQPTGGSTVDEREGHAALTTREREIMGWVVAGHTNAWIARRLWVTEQTIKFHLTNIYRKLGVANRTEASHYVIRRGLVTHHRGDEPASHDEVRPTTLGPVSVVRG